MKCFTPANPASSSGAPAHEFCVTRLQATAATATTGSSRPHSRSAVANSSRHVWRSPSLGHPPAAGSHAGPGLHA